MFLRVKEKVGFWKLATMNHYEVHLIAISRAIASKLFKKNQSLVHFSVINGKIPF